MQVSAEQVLAGLYAWFQQNTWFSKVSIEKADLAQEAAAQQALLLLASKDKAAFMALSPGVQGLAARFVYSFMADLLGPLQNRGWMLIDAPESDSPADLTWRVIASEIERTNPPPLERH
jgi:hypothetical protein